MSRLSLKAAPRDTR